MTYSIYASDGNTLEGFVRDGEIFITIMEDLSLSTAITAKVSIDELTKLVSLLTTDYEEQTK